MTRTGTRTPRGSAWRPQSERAVELLWRRVPSAASRITPALGTILRDGSHLARWPEAGALAPLAALAAGLVLGAVDDKIYASSTLTLSVLMGIAGLGGALGLAAFLGFVAGDLLLRNPAHAQIWGGAPAPSGFEHLYAPFLISYLALAGALVFGPVAANARRRAAAYVSDIGGVAVQGAASAGFVWLWTRGAELALLPLWTYNGRTPDPAAVHALTSGRGTVVAVAGCTSALAGALALLGGRPADEPAKPRPRALVPWPLAVLARAALTTALVSGLASDRADAIVVGGILVAVFAVRAAVFPRADRLTGPLARFPLLLRLAAASGIAYLTRAELLTSSSSSIGSFSPALVAMLVSVFVGSILLSPEVRRESGRRLSPATAAVAATILVLALPAVALAGPPYGPPYDTPASWWVGPMRRDGTTTGRFTVSRRLKGGGVETRHLDGTFACVYDATQGVTPSTPVYWIKGGRPGPLSEVFIIVDGFLGNARGTPVMPVPRTFPFGETSTTAAVFVDNGYTFDPMVPGLGGSVRLAADGSGTVGGTLIWPEGHPVTPGLTPPFGFGRIAISGSWDRCIWGSSLLTETPGDTAAAVVPVLLVMILLDGLGSLGGLGAAAVADGQPGDALFGGPALEIDGSTIGEPWVGSAGMPTHDAALRSLEEWSPTVAGRAARDGWAAALAVDGRLAGRNMTAGDLAGMSTDRLEEIVGRKWDWTPEIEARLLSAGPGSRGIVCVCEGDTAQVINAVNRDGHVVFIDSHATTFGAETVYSSWSAVLEEAVHAAKQYLAVEHDATDPDRADPQSRRVGLIRTYP